MAGRHLSAHRFYALELPKHCGILGYGFGFKEVDHRVTVEEAVRVYVVKKQRGGSRAQLIPKQIDGIPTDVIECGRIRPHAPIECGESIGSVQFLGRGTLGCIVGSMATQVCFPAITS